MRSFCDPYSQIPDTHHSDGVIRVFLDVTVLRVVVCCIQCEKDSCGAPVLLINAPETQLPNLTNCGLSAS